MMRCGIDSIEIERIQQSAARFGDRFYARFFTERERALYGAAPHRLAARFAAKEAAAKALGTGIGQIGWRELEILSDPSGRPLLLLHAAAAGHALALGITGWDISLSHTRQLATAIVIMWASPSEQG